MFEGFSQFVCHHYPQFFGREHLHFGAETEDFVDELVVEFEVIGEDGEIIVHLLLLSRVEGE